MEGSEELRNVLPLNTILPSHAGCYAIYNPQGHRTNTAPGPVCHCSGPSHLFVCTSTGPTAPAQRRPRSGASLLLYSDTTLTLHQHRSVASRTPVHDNIGAGLHRTRSSLTLLRDCSNTAPSPHHSDTAPRPLRHCTNTTQTPHSLWSVTALGLHQRRSNTNRGLTAL